MAFMIYIFLVLSIVSNGVHSAADNSSIPNTKHEPPQPQLQPSEFDRDTLYQLLITSLTPSISTDIYMLSATVVAKPTHSGIIPPHTHQAKYKCAHDALMHNLQFSEYPMYQIHTFLIPTKYASTYHYFIVFPHQNLTPEISEFIASDAFKHLFYCSEQLAFKRISNMPPPDSWTLIEGEHESKLRGSTRTLLTQRDQSGLSQRPPRPPSDGARQRRVSWSGAALSPSPHYSPAGLATPLQDVPQDDSGRNMALQLQALLQQLQFQQNMQYVSSSHQQSSDGDDEDSSADVDRSVSGRIFQNRSRMHNRQVSFDQSGILSESGLPLGSLRRRRRSVSFANPGAARGDIDSESELDSTARTALPFSALLDADPGDHYYVQLLFICWVIIGMLVTSNVVTCCFVCWATSNRSLLLKAEQRQQTLLSKADEQSQQHASLSHMQLSHEHSLQLSHDTSVYCNKSETVARRPQSHHSVPLKPAVKSTAFHGNRKQNRFHMEQFSPILSAYSKSYSYLPTLMALQRQNSQAIYSMPSYPISIPTDPSLRQMSSFLSKQKNVGRNMHMFDSPHANACNAVAPHFVDEDDEKEDANHTSPDDSRSKRSRSFDSSLMYINHIPGTATCTKDKTDKLKDGESSVYSPSIPSSEQKHKNSNK